MADYTLTVLNDRFQSLAKMASGWLLEIPTSANMVVNDILTIQEVNSSNVATGYYMTGVLYRIKNGEFWNQTNTNQFLFFNNIMLYPWIDYSSTTTIVGWSSFTTKQVRYMVIEKTLFIMFDLAGTSNSTTTTFTLPFTTSNSMAISRTATQTINNGTTGTGPARALVNNNSNLVTLHNNWAGSLYAATGTKRSAGTIILELA